MKNNLYRSAYTPVIYEMKDCSVGIFDAEAGCSARRRACRCSSAPSRPDAATTVSLGGHRRR